MEFICFRSVSFSETVAVTIKYQRWEQRFFFEASIDSTHGFRLFPVVLLSENRCRNTIRHRLGENPPFPELPFYHRMGISLFPVILTKNVAVTT